MMSIFRDNLSKLFSTWDHSKKSTRMGLELKSRCCKQYLGGIWTLDFCNRGLTGRPSRNGHYKEFMGSSPWQWKFLIGLQFGVFLNIWRLSQHFVAKSHWTPVRYLIQGIHLTMMPKSKAAVGMNRSELGSPRDIMVQGSFVGWLTKNQN